MFKILLKNVNEFYDCCDSDNDQKLYFRNFLEEDCGK